MELEADTCGALSLGDLGMMKGGTMGAGGGGGGSPAGGGGGGELKSSCGKWEVLVKKRAISESNNPAVLRAAFTLLLVLVCLMKHRGCG